jgi:hypothetical protein
MNLLLVLIIGGTVVAALGLQAAVSIVEALTKRTNP